MTPSRHFRLNTRAFTAFLIVGLVMIAVAGTIVIGVGQGRLRTSFGEHLSQVADHGAAVVDSYVYRRIIDASILARVPVIRAATAEASLVAFDPAASRALDQLWESGQALPPAAAGLLTSAPSAFLADVVKNDPIYREILVADRFGRLAAASARTSDYLQSDEEWWKDAHGDGTHGRLSAGDVRWDESAKAFAIEIAVPVAQPGSESLAGVLKVVADVREIGAVVGGIRLGATGDAVLLREDASIVFSQRLTDPNARFFAPDLLRERLQAMKQGQLTGPLHFGARTADGQARIVGMAPCLIRTSYPQLAWIVAVSQAESELFAPIRAQGLSLVLVLALTALAVLAFAFWFSVRLAAPSAVEDLHLVEHPSVRAVGDAAEEGQSAR